MRRIIIWFAVLACLTVMPPAAARKYEPSKTIVHGDSVLVYKMDGKRIVKIAAQVEPNNGDYVVQWWNKAGERFALFLPSATTIDLWKSELKPFGNALKSVTRIDFDLLGDDRWYGTAKVWTVMPDGSIRLVHKPRPSPPDCTSPASCGG
jgi:hypothetical protein